MFPRIICLEVLHHILLVMEALRQIPPTLPHHRQIILRVLHLRTVTDPYHLPGQVSTTLLHLETRILILRNPKTLRIIVLLLAHRPSHHPTMNKTPSHPSVSQLAKTHNPSLPINPLQYNTSAARYRCQNVNSKTSTRHQNA